MRRTTCCTPEPRIWLLLLLLFTWPASAGQIALIIDDIGARASDRAAFALPTDVTLSFLPHTPYGRELALKAWRQGRETMLHLPMATRGPKDPGPWAIGPDQDAWQVSYRVKKALADIPFTSGVNNHMGSAITPDSEVMAWVMAELQQGNRFFVDSLTTPDSQAYYQAEAAGVASIKRDVFLDPMPGRMIIERQWRQAVSLAQSRGQVVVIGHPYPSTLAFLQEALPALAQQGVTLVPVSRLVRPAGLPLPVQTAQQAPAH
ncbi:divergent polysaccharide deacetylase family protein [Ferrimonas marina]|nr:divergent polysaccharide deacetylase family protein [Ferrimonas marina]